MEIETLVREKSELRTEPTAESGMELALQQLSGKNLYSLEVSVRGGRKTMKINPTHLGLSEGVISQLNQIATGGYTARLSARMRDSLHRLQAMQKTLYQRYTLYSDPLRLLIEDDLPDAMEFIESMKVEAEKLKTEFDGHYPEEIRSFLSAISGILEKAGIDGDRRVAAVNFYASEYPSREEFLSSSLLLIVNGPTKLRSLTGQVAADAEEARAEAERVRIRTEAAELDEQKGAIKKSRAELDAEKSRLEREKRTWETIQKSHEDYGQLLVNATQAAEARAGDEACSSIAEIIDRSAIVKPGQLDERVSRAWETTLQRLDTLAAFDPKISGMVTIARGIRDLLATRPPPPPEEIEKRMAGFKADLLEQLQSGRGEGTQKLQASLSMDIEYRQLTAELAQLAENPDPKQLEAIQGKCISLSNFFAWRHKEIEKKLSAATTALRVKQGLEKPRSNAKPAYDVEAGF